MINSASTTTTSINANYYSAEKDDDINRTEGISSDMSQNKNSAPMISIDEAIERIGYGRFQIRVMIAAGLCFAADAMEVLLLTFLAVILQALWDLTPNQTALMTSIVFLGAMMGTLVLGPLGDHLGRRPVFLLAASLITFFGILTGFTNSFWPLVFTRMMAGFGIGGLTVPFDILAELLPMAHRGRDLLLIEFFWTFGSLVVPIFAYLTLQVQNDHSDIDGNGDDDDDRSWRYFVILCALPCLVSAIIGTWLVPESPRWLLSTGKEDEALAVLRKGAIANQRNVMEILPPDIRLKPEEPETSTIADLFRPNWRYITLCLWATWAGFAILYYGAIIATTLTFSTATTDESDSDPASDSSYNFDYSAIFLSCSAELFGTFFAILAIDRLGRVPIQVICFVSGGLCILLLVMFSSSPDEKEEGGDSAQSKRGVLMTFGFLTRLFMMAGSCTTWVSTAEILTTEIRTTGHAAANAMGRIGGFSAPFLVRESSSPALVGGTMFAIGILAAASASQLPETKDKTMGAHPRKTDVDERLSRVAELQSLAPDVHEIT